MIKLFIAGDFAPVFQEYSPIIQGDYGFLEEVKPFIKEADYSIVNFESPVVIRESKPILKSGPNICCDIKAMECVAESGFKCVTLANNHFFDFGQDGVEDTLYACRTYGVDYVGGGIDVKESQRILYKNINNIRVAIINACENEYSIADTLHGGSNSIDLIRMSQDISEAHNNSEYLILILHGGIEHYHYPTPRMKRLYRYFIDLGADAVVNHHQHCINGYEIYKNKPIFYGLGNFYFPRKNKNKLESWKYGYALHLKLDDHVDFELIPYMQECEVVRLLDKQRFQIEMDKLNVIIKDDKLLQRKFEEHILTLESEFKLSLMPSLLRGRLVSALIRRGYLGKLYKKKHLLSLRNKILCESHQEVFQYLLKILTH